ncbi:MAG: hypothetical protein GEU92_17145 [Alphaproteobacteria bacterium]|nr:hypothetical protein [Alphaproteobacteria bacterium]
MIGKTSKVVFEVVAAILLGLVLVLAGAGWRLSQGPVSLSFLTEEIEAALNDPAAPLLFTLEDTNLAWGGWERTLDLRVVGVRLIARDDRRIVANVPQMAVSLSVRALLAGRLAPTTLEVIGARVALERTREGAFRLAMGGAGPDGATDGAYDFLGNLVAVLSSSPDPARPLTYLQRLSIVDSRAEIADRMTETRWGAPEADIIITRRAEGLRVHFSAGLDLGGEIARLDGDAVWRTPGDAIVLEARFAGVRPALLAAKLPSLARLAALRLPVGGNATATLGTDGSLREASFRLRGGKGSVDIPALWDNPVAVAGLSAQGTLRSGPDMLDVETFEIDLDGPKITGHGSAIRIGRTLAFDGTAVLRALPVKDAATYWPKSAAPPTRDWFFSNVSGGMLKEAQVKLAMHMEGGDSDTLGVDALNGTMDFAGATVAFLEGMPPARNVDATAAFSRDRFLFTFSRGTIEGLRLGSGSARFTALDTDIEQAAIEVVARGRLGDALALLDRPRFDFLGQLGLDPKTVRGDSATRLAITFPLKKTLAAADIGVVAAANLRGVELPDAVMGQPLTDGTLTLRVDRKGMEVKGEARLGPVPADIAWFETFEGKARYNRRYEVKARLDAAQRKAFDLPLADMVDGTVAVDLALLERTRGDGVMEVKLGLKDAVLALPMLNWAKPAGTDGVAWLTVETQKREPVAIRSFEVTSSGLHAKGAVALRNPNGGMTLRLERFTQGATDFSGEVTRDASGALDVEIAGRGLDAARLIRRMTEGGDDGARIPPVALRTRLDQLWFNTGEPISAVTAALHYDGEALRNLDFRGSISDKHGISVALRTTPAKRSFRFTSDNAGRALRALGLTENVRGGRLALNAERAAGEGSAPWRGKATMNDYQLVNAPPLARILTVASLTGINNLLTGQGIAFAGLDLPFVFERPVLRIENARAVGSEIGITGSGTINTATDVWNLEGTLVPAYTINSLLGNIPFLGRLFTGDKGSGVFAATYRVRGKIDDPKAVSVNPLAALAPGFLRNLLDIFRGDQKDEEAAPPAPAAPPAR